MIGLQQFDEKDEKVEEELFAMQEQLAAAQKEVDDIDAEEGLAVNAPESSLSSAAIVTPTLAHQIISSAPPTIVVLTPDINTNATTSSTPAFNATTPAHSLGLADSNSNS